MSCSRFLFSLWLALLPAVMFAQQRPLPPPTQGGQRIELLPGTERLVGGTFNGIEIRKLLGNVSFRQGTTLLYCDSAYQYLDRNALEAFSNVRIIQNDTITITGDQATYNGDTRQARMTGRVVTLRDPRMTLTTTALDYDLNRNLAYYSVGGHLQDPENTLDSRFGYYNTVSKVFSFKRDVKLITKDNTILTDTLQYNTGLKIAYFFGPTRIIGRQGTLYAENGTYNTVKRVSNFARNARIETPNYLLGGDFLTYDEGRQYGIAIGHVSMTSKKDNLVIRGDVGRHWRTLGRTKMFGSPVMRNISNDDTLYLAADTLISQEGRAPLNAKGVLYAYPKAKIFRPDLQGRCDSLTYDRQDSIIYLNKQPMLWNEQNQLTADSMEIRQRKGKVDQMRLYANAFIIGQDTLLNFNQVKGRNMVAYFKDNSIKKVNVLGNAESLYYALEGDTAVSGVNKAVSATMVLRFADNKLQTISFLTNPDASFIPPHELKPEDAKLKDFRWRPTERPTRRAVLGKQFADKPKPKAKPAPKTPAPTNTKPKAAPKKLPVRRPPLAKPAPKPLARPLPAPAASVVPLKK